MRQKGIQQVSNLDQPRVKGASIFGENFKGQIFKVGPQMAGARLGPYKVLDGSSLTGPSLDHAKFGSVHFVAWHI